MSSSNLILSRRLSKEIRLGKLKIGNNNPIIVQSMTNTDTRNVEATVAQIVSLVQAGCELVRLAVIDEQAAAAIKEIKARMQNLAAPYAQIPLVADIHFDYRLALAALKNGVDGLRLNPGNISGAKELDCVVAAAKDVGAPIRIGVNSGSLEKDLLQRFGSPCPEAMVESALRHVRLLEARNFEQIKISIKSSSVLDCVSAYTLLAEQCDYPLHIGVTEAGPNLRGAVKSSVGLGLLLAAGIGDTLRVSLTDTPEKEMLVAFEILRSLGLRSRGPELISCPTCGRTEIALIELATLVEQDLNALTQTFELRGAEYALAASKLKVAIMGCVVNGPGEAREADIGVAGGRGKAQIFRKGKVVKTLRGVEAENSNIIKVLRQEIIDYLGRGDPCTRNCVS